MAYRAGHQLKLNIPSPGRHLHHPAEKGRYMKMLKMFLSAATLLLFGGPLLVIGFTAEAQADLLVTSQNFGRILRYDGATGQFKGNISDNTGFAEQFQGVTFGPDRDMFVAEFGGLQSAVLRFSGSTFQFIGAFAQVGDVVSHLFPTGITFGPDNNLFVASGSGSGDSVLKFNGSTGQLIGTFVPIIGGITDSAHYLKFGPDGNLYVSGASAGVKRYAGMSGALIDTFVPEVGFFQGLDFGPDGNLYVADLRGSDVLRFSGTTGAFIDAFVPSGSGGLSNPQDIRFGSDGLLYVTSANTDSVLRFSGSTGAFVDQFVMPGSGGLDVPMFLALTPPAVSGPSSFILLMAGLGVLGA